MNQYNRWPFAKGSEGNLIVVSITLLITALLHRVGQARVTRFLFLLTAALWATVLYFFRDPDRVTLDNLDLIVAPADGKVVEIVQEYEPKYLNADVIRVSIFLSLLDIHVQRVPISGRVALIEHKAGQFLQAFKPEASEVNEYIAMVIDTDRCGRVLVKQIAGILARRCVNYQEQGDHISVGDRFGMMRFSSRVDLFLPLSSQLSVQVGDKVYGGITALGKCA